MSGVFLLTRQPWNPGGVQASSQWHMLQGEQLRLAPNIEARQAQFHVSLGLQHWAHHARRVSGHAALERLNLTRRELVLLHAVAQPPVPAVSCRPAARHTRTSAQAHSRSAGWSSCTPLQRAQQTLHTCAVPFTHGLLVARQAHSLRRMHSAGGLRTPGKRCALVVQRERMVGALHTTCQGECACRTRA